MPVFLHTLLSKLKSRLIERLHGDVAASDKVLQRYCSCLAGNTKEMMCG